MSQEKIYQPGWGESPKKHHHHSNSKEKQRNRGLGGSLRMRDKQAYYGLLLVALVALVYGAYRIGKVAYHELREMPFDDPMSEMNVDELRIQRVNEYDALLMGDSLAKQYNVDSMKRNVQIETVPVYRPPRKENKWYITSREWKSIRKNYKVWKWIQRRQQEEQEAKVEN